MINKVQLAARVILGLIYFVFGLMGLAMVLGFMHPPQPSMPEGATAFMKGIMGSGYFLPLLKVTETVGGFLVLTGFAAPAALVILAPITLNIILFHAFLTPGAENLPLPILMGVAHVIAMTAYGALYLPLFSKK